MKTLTIITGASRGLGYELAKQSLKPGDTVVTLERKPRADLVGAAEKAGCSFIQFTADLLDRKGAVELLMWLLSDNEYAAYDRLVLINNAGVLGPVGPIENHPPQEAVDCIRVNFEIPVLLTRTFLEETQNWKGERRVMNISSGAGRKSVAGWAMYCSTKAALDRFTDVTALDQKGKPNPARLCSIAPGVVDTPMQARIRSSSKEDFPGLDRFINLEKEGALQSAEETAGKLLNFLHSDAFGQEPIADIRTLNIGE